MATWEHGKGAEYLSTMLHASNRHPSQVIDHSQPKETLKELGVIASAFWNTLVRDLNAEA